MRGLGFMIWQLANMPPVDNLVKLLVNGKVSWVSIKVLDGGNLYNAKGNNQKLLKAYWNAISAAGIEVGGWQFVYGDQPGLEGDAAEAFYEEFHPAHWLVDAEGSYKGFGKAKKAKVYMDKQHNGQVFIALCSYRFPSLHSGIGGFPFSAFLNHDKMDGVAPQVYWIGDHNPAEQTQRSYIEYSKLTNKPFIPIGSSFTDKGWTPTLADFAEFRDWCERIYPAYGYYNLDEIIQGQHWDWFATITDTEPPAPPPPEISDHDKITRVWNFGLSQGWDM